MQDVPAPWAMLMLYADHTRELHLAHLVSTGISGTWKSFYRK